MTKSTYDEVVGTAWRQQQIWSCTADTLKAGITRWRAAALVCGVVGAGLQTLAVQGVSLNADLTKAAGYAGAVALALVPAITAARLAGGQLREWIRARSVSEGLKSEVYLFLTRTDPYGGADAVQQLLDRTHGIEQKARDLARHAVVVEPAGTPLPPVSDAKSYVEHRVNDQIEKYYRRKARTLSRRVSLARGVEFALGLLATVLASISAVNAQAPVGSWVAVVTTATAALTAHVAASRYEYLIVEFTSTAQRLEYLRNRWRAAAAGGLPYPDGDFIRDCEAAISVENQGWMAEWSRPDSPQGEPEQG